MESRPQEILSQDMSSQQKRRDKQLSPYLSKLSKLQVAFVRNGKNPLPINQYKVMVSASFSSKENPDKRMFERDEKGNNIFYYLTFAETNEDLNNFFDKLWKVVRNLMDSDRISRSPLYRRMGNQKLTPFEWALNENNFYYAKLMLPYLLDIHRYDEGTLETVYKLTIIIQENSNFSLHERMSFYFSFLKKLIKNYVIDKKLIMSYIIKMMSNLVYFDYLNKVNTKEIVYSENIPFPHKLITLILDYPAECTEMLNQFDADTLKKLENYLCNHLHHGDTLLTYAIYMIPAEQETVNQLVGDLIRILNIKITNSHGANIFHKSFRNPSATLMIVQALIERVAPEIVLTLLNQKDIHGNSPLADAVDIASKERPKCERFAIIIESIEIILHRFPQMLSEKLNTDGETLRDLLGKNNNRKQFSKLNDFLETSNSCRSLTASLYATPPRKGGSAPSSSSRLHSQRHSIFSPKSQSPAKPRTLAKSYPSIRPSEEVVNQNEADKKHWKLHYKKKMKEKFEKKLEEYKQKFKEKIAQLNQQNTIDLPKTDLQETRQEESHLSTEDNTLTSRVSSENDDLQYLQPAVTPAFMEIDQDITAPSSSFDEVPSFFSDSIPLLTNPEEVRDSPDNKRKREEVNESFASPSEAEKSDQNPSKVKKAKTKSTRPCLSSAPSRESPPPFYLPSITIFSYIKRCGKKYQQSKSEGKAGEWREEPNQLRQEWCTQVYEESQNNSSAKFNQGQWAECYVYLFLLNYYLRKYGSTTLFINEFIPYRSLNSEKLTAEGEKPRAGARISGTNEEKKGKSVCITWFNKNGSGGSNRDIDVRKESLANKKDNYLEVKSHLNNGSEHSMTKSQVMLMLAVSSLTNEKYRILQVNHAGQENVSIEIKESPYQSMNEVAESAVSFKLNFS